MIRYLPWLFPLLAVAQLRSETVVQGRWILTSQGQPADYSCTANRFGIQPSGLTWARDRLWGVSDQSSACRGCLFTLDPSVPGNDPLLLEEDGIPLSYGGRILAIDVEGIALLKATDQETVFVVVVEDRSDAVGLVLDDRRPGAALVVRVPRDSSVALVSRIWEFYIPEGDPIRPYGGDRNRGFEGIAVDTGQSRGYLAYEQAEDGRPRLFTFELPGQAPGTSGPVPVPIEAVSFSLDFPLEGKPDTDLNFNGLALVHTDEETRLLVVCRNRELLLILSLTGPHTAVLEEQIPLRFRSPLGQAIEWVSPEGIALDPNGLRLYVISDPDPSCEGNWRALPNEDLTVGRRAAEAALFSQFVPLLFRLDLPSDSSGPG